MTTFSNITLRAQRAGAADVTTPTRLLSGGAGYPHVVHCHIRRFDGLSGATTVSAGVPLRPGMVMPGQVDRCVVTVAGTPIAIHAAALQGTHGDGSLRAVLVQFPYTLNSGDAIEAVFAVGTADRPVGQRLTQVIAPPSVPNAALLPTQPGYLLQTRFADPSRSVSSVRARGGAFDAYEAAFIQWQEHHWNKDADLWTSNYYDRAAIWFAWWTRSGNPTYWYRGVRMAHAWLRDYALPNGDFVSDFQSTNQGVAQHYHATGVATSRSYLMSWADFRWGITPATFSDVPGGAGDNDHRNLGRRVLAQVLAHRVGGAPTGDTPNYASRLVAFVNRFSTWQQASGRWDFGSYWVNTQANFMVPIAMQGLISAQEEGLLTSAATDTLLVMMERACAYLWDTQWRVSGTPGLFGFQYGDGFSPGPPIADNNTGVAPDLTLLYPGLWAWLYARTTNPMYLTRAHVILDNGQRGAYNIGEKQFNEAHIYSSRVFGYA